MDLYLDGLDCANCAEKIRLASEKLSGVKSAEMNFITKKLSVEFTNEQSNKSDILKSIKGIVKSLEPDVIVRTTDNNKMIKAFNDSDEKFDKIQKILRFTVSALLFILGLIFEGKPSELWFFVASYFIIGYDVIRKAGYNILKGKPFDECLLMTIASLGAFFINGYHEAVAVMYLYQVGEAFQDYAVERSRKSITSLLNIRPDFANVMRNGEVVKVSPEIVNIGEIVLIKAGEKIPLDARIIKGKTTLDTSALTGESIPANAEYGDVILSGCVNLSGYIEAEVIKEFSESTVSKILELVENSAAKKAKTESFITKFARIYTPCVVIIALLIFVIPNLININDFLSLEKPQYAINLLFAENGWLYRSLQFLVVSCPCALVISVPLSFFGGIGGAAKRGILIKGGNSLEILADCSTIVFDKTGTLTSGSFEVSEINCGNSDFTNDEILKFAAIAEKNSNHPIGISILNFYTKNFDDVLPDDVSYTELAGLGIKAQTQDGVIILTGNKKLMDLQGVIIPEAENIIGSVVYISVNDVYAGNIIISDVIKTDSKHTISLLKKQGIIPFMLTGDRKISAEHTAKALEIDKYKAELLPADKVYAIEEIMAENTDGKTAFVGDGINDAPVLMRSDIGIAMGAMGSDAAIEAADIVLMTDEPARIIDAIKFAKKTKRIVKQNIIFSIGVKFLVLILALFGLTTMWAAVFADVGVSFIAIINALRARKINL